ncbi:MAG: Spy/CpxP family protein refolding chaperone [Proteobacteria bacterium]|nr:Spy/CpxP family protein refolding chaperone [Pseudomonadota bacterium]
MPARPFAATALVVTLLALGGATALLPTAGVAQQAPPGTAQPPRERPSPGRHIEGRIAFMRAELKITDTQQVHWEQVATAMRASARQMDQMAQQTRGARDQTQSAIDRLDQRANFAAARAAADKSFADAFKPLYASLSDDQKKSADELFARPPRRSGRR